jgi:hypothetical protein
MNTVYMYIISLTFVDRMKIGVIKYRININHLLTSIGYTHEVSEICQYSDGICDMMRVDAEIFTIDQTKDISV